MRNNRLSIISMSALTAAMLGFTGCGDSESITINYDQSTTTTTGTTTSTTTSTCPSFATALTKINDKDVCELSGRYTTNITLTNDKYWALDGEVVIGGDNVNSATLTINAGTTIYGSNGPDFLLISRGSQIDAQGSLTAPITFTSAQDVLGTATATSRGQWGGLVIAGNATTNQGVDVTFEFSDTGAKFGGTNDADNSGTLSYVVVKHAGYEVRPDQELNGITFGGVGSGTTVDHIEVYNNFDDGIEFFGGTVNAKYIALVGNGDDNVDTDMGYRGKLQYVYVKQTQVLSSDPRGFEMDNWGASPDLTPTSSPMIANFEIHGVAAGDQGIMLRRGTDFMAINGYVTGFGSALLEVRNDETWLEGLQFFGVGLNAATDAELYGVASNTVYTQADVKALFEGEVTNVTGTTAATPIDPSTKDAWFDAATFVGSYDQNGIDWRQGWTVGIFDENCPSGTTTQADQINGKVVCELTGRITADLTLSADKYWALNGEVIIGGDNTSPTTLTINPGTTIFGARGADFLAIARGSEIQALGTEANPIIMTSAQDVQGTATSNDRGQWGGLVIAGNATTNQGADVTFEFSNTGLKFGGADDADSSGRLSYVIVKHAGYEVRPDQELNGITFGGVGSGTVVDHIEVYNNFDDGIEFFGGTVNAKYIVLIGNGDDNVDTDMGYRGKLQYVYVKQTTVLSSDPRGFEMDNWGASHDLTPRSAPMIANFELHGAVTADQGIMLRRGTDFNGINGFVTGFGAPLLEIRDDSTWTAVNEAGTFTSIALDATTDAALYGATGTHTATDVKNLFESSTNFATGTTTTTATDPKTLDAWFDTTNFIGAYDRAGTDWRQGWAVGL